MTVPDLRHTTAARRNLELKVRVPRPELAVVRDAIHHLGDTVREVQRQEDRYFTVPGGRLKLRTIAREGEDARCELIAYRRPDERGSRWSAYAITPLEFATAESLATTLAQVLPVRVVVRKRREIYLHGATRIHVDDVERLGTFVELETVIGNQADNEAAAEHRHVIETLGLGAWPVEAGSYSDLVEADAGHDRECQAR